MNKLIKIKQLLLKQKKEVEKEIKEVEQDDPVMETFIAESSEPGTDSWMADVHGRVVAVKQNLQDLLKKIQKSLQALKSGKYGKCENCGQKIEEKRLAAMPTATLCISCSKKNIKKKL